VEEDRRNCIRVLIVSKGWQTELSTNPAQPPATKSKAGFFFLVLALFEDMVALDIDSRQGVLVDQSRTLVRQSAVLIERVSKTTMTLFFGAVENINRLYICPPLRGRGLAKFGEISKFAFEPSQIS
jgi:hypothetical protein